MANLRIPKLKSLKMTKPAGGAMRMPGLRTTLAKTSGLPRAKAKLIVGSRKR